MAKDQTKRIQPSILQADRDSHAAIKAMADYDPANEAYTKEKLQAAQDFVVTQREKEVEQQALADAARDATVAAEWDFQQPYAWRGGPSASAIRREQRPARRGR